MPLYLAMGAFVAMSMVACSDDDDNDNVSSNTSNSSTSSDSSTSDDSSTSNKEGLLETVIEQYVENSVVPTYHGLADAAIDLADACRTMCDAGVDGLTLSMIQEADDAWIDARRYWELSEAWLFGAVADYNIDPHIDTWPLDKTAMEALLSNSSQMAQMYDEESAANYVSNNLGQGLLGFHAVEYLLFEPEDDETDTTSPRPVSRYTQNELYYLAAVADDLRNQCIRAYVSWADEGTLESTAYWTYLEDAELEPTWYYGDSMKNAGQSGSTYKSYAAAVYELIYGMQDIVDEVGNQKIGNPIGSATGSGYDPSYIESPYALNSIVDFVDNLKSVRTAYMGYQTESGISEGYIRTSTYSLSDYIKSVDADMDTEVQTLISDAITAIGNMKEPFAATCVPGGSYDSINQAAVDACNAIVDILDELVGVVQSAD